LANVSLIVPALTSKLAVRLPFAKYKPTTSPRGQLVLLVLLLSFNARNRTSLEKRAIDKPMNESEAIAAASAI
jgi:hypothetical protein